MAKSVIINGVTYTSVPSVTIPSSADPNETVAFYETSTATATAGDLLTGKTMFNANGSVGGSMTNNGAVTGTISTKAGTYTIPAGYHDGGGSVQIASAEQSKIITGNIKSGVTILGVSGSSSVVDTADATSSSAQILTGYTAYVNGSKVTGTLSSPTISQDSITKVLSIS